MGKACIGPRRRWVDVSVLIRVEKVKLVVVVVFTHGRCLSFCRLIKSPSRCVAFDNQSQISDTGSVMLYSIENRMKENDV